MLQNFKLEGKTALVTGALRGLGYTMAHALANAGADLVVLDIESKGAEQAVEKLCSHGTRVCFIQADVTDRSNLASCIAQAKQHTGTLDILVNNAGICEHEAAEQMSDDQWLRVMDVNINGVFWMSREVGKIMLQQQSGSIINIASMSGLIVNTPQKQCAYNVSKAGVIMLTKSLAAEWAPRNVRVNAIAPGYLKTEMTRPFFEENKDNVKDIWLSRIPMARPGQPDELSGAVIYLASETSSYVTGSVHVIDGGYTVW